MLGSGDPDVEQKIGIINTAKVALRPAMMVTRERARFGFGLASSGVALIMPCSTGDAEPTTGRERPCALADGRLWRRQPLPLSSPLSAWILHHPPETKPPGVFLYGERTVARLDASHRDGAAVFSRRSAEPGRRLVDRGSPE